MNRRRRLAVSIVVAVFGLTVPTHAEGAELTFPNLVPNVVDVFVFPTSGTEPRLLYFDTWAQNLGTVPLQLTLDDVQNPQSSTVSQCVSWTAGRLCNEQRPVGGFTWHQEHTHFHFEDFASYEFRRLRNNGRPDYRPQGLIAVSEKVSFCLMDTVPVRDDAFPVAFYQTCTPAVQGISPGWTDIYGGGLPGQQFSLDGLADGRYALIVRMDDTNRLYETDDGDNVVEATVELSGNGTQAQVVARNYP